MVNFISVRKTAIFLMVGVLSCSLGSFAVASAKKEKNSETDEKSWIVPTHIQLNPIMIPVEGRRAAPVTVYLEASNKKYVGNICNFVPRLLDAIYKVLTRNPVPVRRSRLVLKNVPQQLLFSMNQAVGNREFGNSQIKKVFIVAGATKMGGGSITRLPFARINGCRSIRRAEAERMKAEAAKKNQ